MSVLVVGSIAYDDVQTPFGKRTSLLGGSATYFSIAASYFTKVKVVGTVGRDFLDNDRDILISHDVDVSGLYTANADTFRWVGHYMNDINQAVTIETHSNIFNSFELKLTEQHKNSDYVFLANIDPSIQTAVAKSVKSPKVIACDTMNFWISQRSAEVVELISMCDIVMMNESEAKQLTGEKQLYNSAYALLELGASVAVIKRGEYGAALFLSNACFAIPAYPVNPVVDPTGAGDSFAGGFIGWLNYAGNLNKETLKRAMVFGSTMASFTVSGFGIEHIKKLNRQSIYSRAKQFEDLTKFSLPQDINWI